MLALIIAGPLGAGKTSLLLRLARYIQSRGPQKVGIIENEVGTIDIDSTWLKREGMEVRDILSGCICCSLRGSLEATASQFIAEYSPEILLVEPSGIAGTDTVIKVLKDTLPKNWTVKCLYLLDIQRLQRLSRLSPFFIHCIQTADAVILTKGDAAEPAEISSAYSHIRSFTKGAVINGALLEEIMTLIYQPAPSAGEKKNSSSPKPPSAAAISRRWRMAGGIEEARGILQGIQRALSQRSEAVPGHIKLLLSGKSTILLSLTDSDGTISVRGNSHPTDESCRADLNALVYGLDQRSLADMIDAVLHDYAYESI